MCLLTDLIAGLGQQVPASLSSVKVATSPGGIDACVRLARSWRNSRDDRDSYVAAANKVEQEFSLGQLAFEAKSLTEIETFQAVERALLRHVENELLDKARPDLLQLAVSRLSRFWAEAIPAVQARWALIAAAAEVLLEADRVAKEIKKPPTTVPALVKAYAEGDEPWCLLDTHHRHMESRKYNFEFDSDNEHQGLDKLITKAEQRYNEVCSSLAKHFVTQFSKVKHPIKGLLRQRDFFETQVKPKLDGGKVAYVWVDALRFEMARELCRLLKDDFDLTLQPAIATLPTITEIGMAALLPKAHEAAKVVSVGGGKLGLEISGKVIKDRKDRVAFLKEHAGVPVYRLQAGRPAAQTEAEGQGRHPERQADPRHVAGNRRVRREPTTKLARLQMDSMLPYLRRGVRILSDHGIKTIILAADHGHLFADEIGEDMKIDAPGGKTADLHRRVWVGVGGTSEPSYLRTPLSSLGIDSDLDIATPWTFGLLQVEGREPGLFPRRLVAPRVDRPGGRHDARRPRRAGRLTGIQWTLTPGSAKLSTRFFSVQIAGRRASRAYSGSSRPKCESRSGPTRKSSRCPVSASYGFEDATGEVKLKVAERTTQSRSSRTPSP